MARSPRNPGAFYARVLLIAGYGPSRSGAEVVVARLRDLDRTFLMMESEFQLNARDAVSGPAIGVPATGECSVMAGDPAGAGRPCLRRVALGMHSAMHPRPRHFRHRACPGTFW